MKECSPAYSHDRQYYWQSNCYDGWRDCPNGDDEDPKNTNCLRISTCTGIGRHNNSNFLSYSKKIYYFFVSHGLVKSLLETSFSK